MCAKFVTAAEAVQLFDDNYTIATDGFVATSFPEELAVELEKRYLETGRPKNLTVIFCAGQGDSKEKGVNRFGHKGMIKRVIGGHWGLVTKVQKLALDNEIEAYNVPQGVISHLFRDIAAKKPGTLTHVGLNTYIDPRYGGGKMNERTKEDIVELMHIDGKEYLLYKCFPIHGAILRGTTADENANITLEKEALSLELLAIAQAVKNSGGKVLVQVERIAKAGTLNPKLVKIPGIYVDAVVVASKPEYQNLTYGTPYNAVYSGEIRSPNVSFLNLPMDERKIICRRSLMELKGNMISNLGIGMPEGISLVANEEGISDRLMLTVEGGLIGGIPLSGLDFGCCINADAVIDQPSQFDFYQGGGLDIAFLGLAQADRKGNINVSKFGTKLTGCGGFIDISQNAKKVVYCGTFTAKGLKIACDNGRLMILEEGSVKKFIQDVEQITFSADYALKSGQPVLYITERAVFELTREGPMLTEIAPGIDPQKDILDQMEFTPSISKELKLMDARLYKEEIMNIKEEDINEA